MTLYSKLTEAGIEVANHYSDLMFPVTEESTKIVKSMPNICYEKFTNQITRTLWYYVPFEYEPYWESKRSHNEI